MLSVEIARALRDAGLRWEPTRGDHFILADKGMDDHVFVLSDMTIEVHEFVSGPVIGFNGTTEWALDSLDAKEALWVPTEAQLRDLIGAGFQQLERYDDYFAVTYLRDATPAVAEGPTAADAYGSALLDVLTTRT